MAENYVTNVLPPVQNQYVEDQKVVYEEDDNTSQGSTIVITHLEPQGSDEGTKTKESAEQKAVNEQCDKTLKQAAIEVEKLQELEGLNGLPVSEESTKKVVEEGASLGAKISELLAKRPKSVEAFFKLAEDKQYDFICNFISDLYFKGVELSKTLPLMDKLEELDESKTVESKGIKLTLLKVVRCMAKFLTQTALFTFDVVGIVGLCSLRILGHITGELGEAGKAVGRSFNNRYGYLATKKEHK